TGRLSSDGLRFPNWGSLVANRRSELDLKTTSALVNGPLRDTGVRDGYRGQEAGLLGEEWNPNVVSLDLDDEPESVIRMYGDSEFGRLLLRSRQLIESRISCVTVNLFDTLHQRVTWDCHGDRYCGPATLKDYQDRLCPEFDRAMSGLLDDLAQRGMLDDTLVVATGEFGRTPYINEEQGRDHWTNCWSGFVAGGKMTGGAVIGATDSTASEVVDRPVSPGELTATLLAWSGFDTNALTRVSESEQIALVPHAPLTELWG
ncbi:MAG: DUF1501 domain-containing protein, partial [Planctomycetes bacterium]|nr:DUF1501 domain-containing protein [Planctomycetota bacterium]